MGNKICFVGTEITHSKGSTFVGGHVNTVRARDVSREMLKESKRKAFVRHADLCLILADVGFFPFRKAVLNTCISINVLDHVYDISSFLKEARYVLKTECFLIFNFSNMLSPYLPIAAIVNSKNQAIFKRSKIYSRWYTLREIFILLLITKFALKDFRGCMIASPLPLGEKLVKIIQIINFSIENSRLKLLSGSLFVKAQPTYAKFYLI